MNISDEEIINLLKKLGSIPENILDQVQKNANRDRVSFLSALIAQGFLSEEQAAEIVADILGLSVIKLPDREIPDAILRIIPLLVARSRRAIAFSSDENGLAVAMEDPTDIQFRDFLTKKTGMPVRIFLATAGDIDAGLGLYVKDIGHTFDEIMAEHVARAEKGGDELPIIRIVDTLLLYAYQNKASDIHIEPREASAVARFRIDGILYDVLTFSERIHHQIVARLKVMARLRTDEHQTPQDGKIRARLEGSHSLVDVRLSVVPTTEGEKIVLRILAERMRQFSLSTLGISEGDLENVIDAYQKPHGMILSTGPTGSGKTTSLYAILKILNRPNVNIMTIEDPVEYDMEGINQIQVNQRANLTFASGLRSILRQDPNIVLVGEIRDEETADIAINLSMTGHLVLSTLHANDAATTIPRLLDLRIEPFLVASTVSVIIAQRLVRCIHSPCRVSEEVSLESLIQELGPRLVERMFPETRETARAHVRLYRGKGCSICHGSGYSGRIGIFEVLKIDENIRHAIMERATASEIQQIAVQNGMRTMIEDGIEKARRGITSIEEVIRVAKE